MRLSSHARSTSGRVCFVWYGCVCYFCEAGTIGYPTADDRFSKAPEITMVADGCYILSIPSYHRYHLLFVGDLMVLKWYRREGAPNRYNGYRRRIRTPADYPSNTRWYPWLLLHGTQACKNPSFRGVATVCRWCRFCGRRYNGRLSGRYHHYHRLRWQFDGSLMVVYGSRW